MSDMLNNIQTNIDDSVIDFMSRTTGVKYSDEQLAILKQKGGMCILASAGSGKTTIMNHLIAKRIQTREIDDPNKLLCTTFSRTGANEMGQRLEQLLNQLGVRAKAQVKTLHAVYLQLLKDLGYNLNIVENSSKMRYIREACKEQGIHLEDDEYQTLESIFGYQINNLLSDSDLFKSYAYTLREQIPLEKYSSIRQLFNNKKQIDGCMDFDDMQLFVYTLLKSPQYGPAIQQYCHSLWQHIYVDEAQDVSKIQFEILKMLISDPNKLVFIGDDDQCIYEWRGADPSIILNICGVYTDLSLMKLTTNYRCKSNIVDKADIGIKFNRTRSNKTMTAFNKGGTIKVCDVGDGNIYSMSKYAYKYIKELIIDKGVSPSDIAVLSRNNQHLTILNNMLFKEGIYCNATEDMRFTKCGIYKMIEGIIQMGQNTTNGNITANNLWKCCIYMKRSAANEIGKLQSAYGVSLKDILGFILTEYGRRSVGWVNPGMKVSKLDYGKYTDFMDRLSSATVENLVTIYNILDKETSTKATIALLYMFLETKVSLFFKMEENSRFADGYIEYMCSLIEELGITNFNKYIKTTNQFETGGMAVLSPMVTMTTMHGAKGREWEYVIIFADDNVSFPSFQNISCCMEDGVPDSDIRRMIDENRRLHYVAMTRAKSNLTIFGNKKNLSVYTLEALGVMNFGNDNDSNIIAMSQHGLYKDLVDKTYDTIFSDNSGYKLSISIDNLDTKVEKSYLASEQENQGIDNSFNINNMQTYAPVQLGD